MSSERAEQARQRRRDRRILITVAVAIVALIGAGIGFQAWRTSRAPVAAPGGSASLSLSPTSITDGEPIVLGDSAAPVTITLYEDFHCPHCADFEDRFGPTITAAQDAGKVTVELYPMAFVDSGSVSAANAMACAAEAGFGQAYYTGLFANHTRQWSDKQLISLADQIAGDQTPAGFPACVQRLTHRGWVDSINAAADQAGVNETPTMNLAGTRVDISTLTVDALDQLISDAASSSN